MCVLRARIKESKKKQDSLTRVIRANQLFNKTLYVRREGRIFIERGRDWKKVGSPWKKPFPPPGLVAFIIYLYKKKRIESFSLLFMRYRKERQSVMFSVGVRATKVMYINSVWLIFFRVTTAMQQKEGKRRPNSTATCLVTYPRTRVARVSRLH